MPLTAYNSSFGLAMTFDLWHWKFFHQCPLTWRIFVPSFIKIPPLSTEISRQAEKVLSNERKDGRTDGPTDDPETQASCHLMLGRRLIRLRVAYYNSKFHNFTQLLFWTITVSSCARSQCWNFSRSGHWTPPPPLVTNLPQIFRLLLIL